MENDFTVSGAVLAEMFGVTKRSILNWTDSGWLVKAPAPRNQSLYFVLASWKLWDAHRQAEIADATKDSDDIDELKVKKLQAEIQYAETRNQKIEGKLIPIEILEAQWSRLIIGCRNNFLALPAKLKLHLGLGKKDTAFIDGMIRETLEASAFVEGKVPYAPEDDDED